MSAGFWLALFGAVVLVAFVGAYLLYTLAGWSWLRPALGRVRRAGVAFGGAATLAGLLSAPGPDTAVLAFSVIVMGGYAIRNQWVFPQPATVFVKSDSQLEPDALLAVVPSGGAVPLVWLAKKRTVICGDTLLVYCGIARSLCAFEYRKGSAFAATLPHDTGFYVGDDEHRWDGVNGVSQLEHPDLSAQRVRAMTFDQWKSEYTGAQLMLPGTDGDLPRYTWRKAMVRKARGVDGAADWGFVNEGKWYAWQPSSDAGSAAELYISRWAALARNWAIVDKTDG